MEGPYCFLIQTLSVTYLFFLPLKLEGFEVTHLPMVPEIFSLMAWLCTAGFIALSCNWVFLWFLTRIDPPQLNQWASLWFLSLYPSPVDLTSPSSFSKLDHPSSRLKMKGSRFIYLFFKYLGKSLKFGSSFLECNVRNVTLCQLLVHPWLNPALVPLGMCSS